MTMALQRFNAEIVLRPWRERDLPLLMDLRNDTTLQAQLLSTARGSDMAAVREWLDRRTAGPERLFRVIADRAGDAALGYLQAEAVNAEAGHWQFGICLAPAHQGTGRGSAALLALEQELAEGKTARRLSLEVDEENQNAIRCYRKLGFEWTGTPPLEVVVCGLRRKVRVMDKAIAVDGREA
jgi:RimJ/RimL family protein N-acetyltransferase